MKAFRTKGLGDTATNAGTLFSAPDSDQPLTYTQVPVDPNSPAYLPNGGVVKRICGLRASDPNSEEPDSSKWITLPPPIPKDTVFWDLKEPRNRAYSDVDGFCVYDPYEQQFIEGSEAAVAQGQATASAQAAAQAAASTAEGEMTTRLRLLGLSDEEIAQVLAEQAAASTSAPAPAPVPESVAPAVVPVSTAPKSPALLYGALALGALALLFLPNRSSSPSSSE